MDESDDLFVDIIINIVYRIIELNMEGKVVVGYFCLFVGMIDVKVKEILNFLK